MKMYVLIKLVSGQSPEIVDTYSSRKAADANLSIARAENQRARARWEMLEEMDKLGIEIPNAFLSEYNEGAFVYGSRDPVQFKILIAKG